MPNYLVINITEVIVKRLTIKAKGWKLDKKIFDLVKERGFNISNPDQKKGYFIDILHDTKTIGYDLVAVDSLRNAYNIVDTEDLAIVTDWLDDHAETNS